jgi:hypothetical protein
MNTNRIPIDHTPWKEYTKTLKDFKAFWDFWEIKKVKRNGKIRNEYKHTLV